MEKSINNIQTMNKPENSKNTRSSNKIKQIQSHILDLTQIDGNGEFLCPECGRKISPDDCTEKDYSILEIKMETESLDEVIIRCNVCSTTIHLIGFSLLHKLSRKETKKHPKLKKKKMILDSFSHGISF